MNETALSEGQFGIAAFVTLFLVRESVVKVTLTPSPHCRNRSVISVM